MFGVTLLYILIMFEIRLDNWWTMLGIQGLLMADE